MMLLANLKTQGDKCTNHPALTSKMLGLPLQKEVRQQHPLFV
jgi:hypothetical protein